MTEIWRRLRQLDGKIAEKMGFNGCYPVSGQTYSRKVDTRVLNILSGIAQSAHKFSNDIRLLQHLKEIEEPFEKNQIGSSAMAYKRNPMRSERIAALANFVISGVLNPAITASTQWFERTLDDSANKRLSVSESFLATDGILETLHEHHFGTCRLSEGDKCQTHERAAVHGNGKHHDGRCKGRRRQTGAPRKDPRAFHGGRQSASRKRAQKTICSTGSLQTRTST